jgi:serine/threonine protein kinase
VDQRKTIGRYQILERIASGSQGSVDRAFDSEAGRLVAIKVLHPSYHKDQSFIDRFKREADLAAQVDHPNVVRIYDFDEDGNQHFIAMEFLPENLRRLIDQGQLPATWTASISAQIADGLGAIHALGIVHRDMKPHNVLITPDGVPKITDFGIARGEELSTITATGVMMGTPHYMAPEQAEGHRADARSDVYALGCMMYQMLTGEVPFTGDTPLSVLKKHVETQARPVSELVDDILPAFVLVIERALAKDPAQRFADGNSMAKAVREAMPEIVVAAGEQPTVVGAPSLAELPVHPSVADAASKGDTWKAQGAKLVDALDEKFDQKQQTVSNDHSKLEVQSEAPVSVIEVPEKAEKKVEKTSGKKVSEHFVSDAVQHPATLFFIGLFGLSIIEMVGISPFPTVPKPMPVILLGLSVIFGLLTFLIVYTHYKEAAKSE